MITRISYKSYMTLYDYQGSYMTLYDYRDFCMTGNPGCQKSTGKTKIRINSTQIYTMKMLCSPDTMFSSLLIGLRCAYFFDHNKNDDIKIR